MPAINLKEVPIDVMKIVLREQGKLKAEKGIGQYSLEKTVYKIIRDFKEIKDKENESGKN